MESSIDSYERGRDPLEGRLQEAALGDEQHQPRHEDQADQGRQHRNARCERARTEVALGPGYGACFVARADGDDWLFATSYDRELVVECALLLMARLQPRR